MASFHFSIKSGKKGTAADHAAYIAREGVFDKAEKKQDLVVKGYGNLPEWSKGNPSKFWQVADLTERVNGSAYREYVVALPRELTTKQNIELVEAFIEQEIGDKAYQFAVHSPSAALDSADQTHGHIMFCDRRPDGIERGPDQQFRRYQPTNPSKGGAKKDSGGKDPATLRESVKRLRERFADMQNAHLEKYGHEARVDSRSNKERGIAQEPERHLGPVRINNMTADEKEAYVNKRQTPQQGSAQ